MNSTLERLRDFLACGLKAQKAADDVLLLQRCRDCLVKWAVRGAQNRRAKKHVVETNELIDEIDARLRR